ncbi:MAG: MarR family transcriptional regulator [Nanoarchaeota archaeon]|nr:MarR family transcriptional regulator [Nanoarchaeota archaeon]
MKNRTVGYLVISVSLLIGFIIYIFNRALTEIVNENCSHGVSCPMWQTIDTQTYIGTGIMVSIILVGLYLVIFAKDDEAQKHELKKAELIIPENLEPDERTVLEHIIGSDGTIFQSALVEATMFSKVKVTRLLDRLEGKGLIERKRRGMTNIVILKH